VKNQDDFDKAIFEQFWVHARHIESERMWIMGIWLGITGVMYSEIWTMKDTLSWGLQTLKSITLAHLVVTVAVLVIISKLQLEFDRYILNIRKIGEDFQKNFYQIAGLWEIMTRIKILKWFLNAICTIGGISSAILVAGMVLDLTLFTRHAIEKRFICSFPCLLIMFFEWIPPFIGYQVLFQHVTKRLKKKITGEDNHNSSTVASEKK
jgi:hypothetical protein